MPYDEFGLFSMPGQANFGRGDNPLANTVGSVGPAMQEFGTQCSIS